MVSDPSAVRHIFSIGHSNQSLDQFLNLLKRHEIEAVVDSRSYPASKYAPQFNRPILEEALPRHSIRYKFQGDELGGRPRDEAYYDTEGYVLYGKVADADFFLEGIRRLERSVEKYRIALLCSEENPATCHRRLLIGRVLADRGILMSHIRGDGRLEPESEFVPGASDTVPADRQLALFDGAEAPEWKSAQSVLQRSPHASSSAH